MNPEYGNYYEDAIDKYLFPPAANGFHGSAEDEITDDEDYLEFEELQAADFFTDEDFYF